MGALFSPPIVDHRLGGILIECYDVAGEADWPEVGIEGVDFVQEAVVIQMISVQVQGPN